MSPETKQAKTQGDFENTRQDQNHQLVKKLRNNLKLFQFRFMLENQFWYQAVVDPNKCDGQPGKVVAVDVLLFSIEVS